MLTGKVALITGGAKGIGRAIALEMAKNGAQVIINYQGSKEKAEETVKEILEQGGQASCYPCNVADHDMVQKMTAELINRYGHIDILVNNAGITRDNLILKMTEEDFNLVLDTNLKGTFHTIKHLTRPMIRQKGGKIINITSVSGILGNAGQANYAASKAGVIGLTRTMARELASRNIQVNAIAPGFVNTDMTEKLSESVKASAIGQIPLKRFGNPEEIAAMAVFLASNKADYITGQVIHIDGGMAM